MQNHNDHAGRAQKRGKKPLFWGFVNGKIDARRSSLPVMILFCCIFMTGWATGWEDVRRESEKIKSLSADFSQTKHMQILKKPLVSQGRFYFHAPDSVRWEYFTPVKSVLLMGKKGIKKYTMGNRGFVEDASGSALSVQIVLEQVSQWSRGRFEDNEFFSANLQGGRAPRITLTPREKGTARMIERIVIDLSPEKPGVIKMMKIIEGERNYTVFEFTGVQLNAKIAETLFDAP